MKTEKGKFIINDNNIKKMIIKRINESINKTKISKLNPIKKEINHTNKKLNLTLNNNSKLDLKNNENKKVINSNSNDIHNNCNNIFLENNLYPFNIKKARNSIKYEKEKKNYPTRSKAIEFFEINFNDKNILNTEYKNSNYKENEFIFNINNKTFNEESIRTLYLNSDENNNNNEQRDNIKNIFNNNKNNNEKIYNSKPVERIIYFRNFLSKQKAKKRHSYENNSYISNRNNKQSDNLWNLSTLEFSNLEKTNTNRCNNNNSLFLNDTKNKICLNKTYNRVYTNTNLLNLQKNRNGISYNHKTLDHNNITKKNSSFVYIKNIVPNKIKHNSSKSQENIHGNKTKYSFLFNKKNIFNNRHKWYLSKINDIVKIQKWWKDMIYRMYIEKKIIYIQKKYKKYLNNKRNKNNLNFYENKINDIILIQREWRQFKRRMVKNDNSKKLDYSNDDSYEKDIPRLIPFKLDNFEINTLSESYLDTIKSKKDNNNEKNNSLQKNIYIKKNIKKKQLKKNNTVSNFFFSKYAIFPPSKNNNSNNIIIQKNIINFTINSNKKTQTNNNNKNKYILVKNISIEINKVLHKNNISDIIHHIPINIKCFIEKRYESKIYKIDAIKNDCFISKTTKSKNMRDKILLLQKSVKKYLEHKNIFMKKPKSNVNYITKVKKGINLLGNSNRNQSNQSDIFSFNGSNFIERINKDKINEKELYNLKKDKNLISNNVNLFSFDNRDNTNLIININEKLKKLFKKNFIFLLISNIKYIKFILIIKDIIINHIDKNIFDSLKLYILFENQAKIENIIDNDEIDNKLNNTKCIKNRILLEYKNLDINENNDDNLAYYIYNYFYNEKNYTNISIKLIKERLIKSPIINKTQNNIFNYMQTLYNDIISNKICNECFCKYGENFNDNCLCHFNNNKTQNKNGISLYRQKMNKIIHDINNKKRLLNNNNKININIIKTNKENENNVNIEDNYNFKINYIKVKNERDKNNTINRYDTDSVNSRSRSVSK